MYHVKFEYIIQTYIYIYMYIYFRNIYRARASHCCFSWWSFGSFVDPCRTFRQIYTAVFPTVAHYSDQKLVSWLGRYVGFRPLSVSGIAALYSEQKTGFPVARAVITARFRHMHGSFPTGSHISDKTLVSRENGNFWKTKKLVKPILRSGIGLTIFLVSQWSRYLVTDANCLETSTVRRWWWALYIIFTPWHALSSWIRWTLHQQLEDTALPP